MIDDGGGGEARKEAAGERKRKVRKILVNSRLVPLPHITVK